MKRRGVIILIAIMVIFMAAGLTHITVPGCHQTLSSLDIIVAFDPCNKATMVLGGLSSFFIAYAFIRVLAFLLNKADILTLRHLLYALMSPITASKALDTFLVEHGGSLYGARYDESGRHWRWFYIIFLGIVPIMMATGPLWFCYGAFAYSFLGAVVVRRQWICDEDAREIFEDTRPDWNPKGLELTDEMLFLIGVLFFYHIPILYWRLAVDQSLFDIPESGSFFTMLVFVWDKYARGLLVFNFFGLYPWPDPSGITAVTGGLGKQLTMALPVLFDLVILTSIRRLFRIIERLLTKQGPTVTREFDSWKT